MAWMKAMPVGACVLSVVLSAGCSRNDNPQGDGTGGSASEMTDSNLAKHYLETRDFVKARETLERLVASEQAVPEEYAQLSELHLSDGKREAGEQALRQGLARFPKHPYLTFRLGSYLAALTRYKEAVVLLLEAESLTPGDPNVIKTLSVAQARLGDHVAAAASAGRLYALASGREEGILYASQLEASGDTVAAERIYREVLVADPDNFLVQNNLAVLLAETDRLQEAERLAGRAVEKSPKNGRALDTLGWVQYRGGRLAEAAETLERAITLAPDVGAVHYHHGLVLAALGKQAQANQAFSEALRLEPSAGWAAEARAALAGTETSP